MTIAFVQALGVTAPATTSSFTITAGANTTAGNRVIVRVTSTGGNRVSTITDARGNSYAADKASSSTAATIEVWSALISTQVLSGDLITVTMTSSKSGTGGSADEFSGIATSSPVDATGEATSVTTSVTAALSTATTATTDMIFTAASGSSTGTWTYPGGSYVALANPGGSVKYQGAYWINPGSTGTFSVTWGDSAAANMEVVSVAYKAASGGPPPITLSPTSLPVMAVGSPVSQTITPSGGTGTGYSQAVSGGAVPGGTSLTSGGLFSGMPTTAGAYSFADTCTDSGSNTGSQTYSGTVQAAIVISPSSLPAMTQGSPVSQALSSSGGSGTGYTYSATGVPAGCSLTSGGLFSGTPSGSGAYSMAVTSIDSNGNTGTQTFTGTIAGSAPSTNYFPARPLNVIFEILINGTFVDISDFVYQRDDIVITGGSQDQQDKPSSAQVNLTLNNRDGRFSPNFVGGAYYPYLQRNVQLRISVNDKSANGTVYNGYRFWGAVSDWPPNSDLSATDIYCDITASGPFRYIRQGGGEGSALTRYFNNLTGQYAPIAYWPAEEDNLSTIVGSGLAGGQLMSVSGNPKWKAISKFNGSAPIGVLNGSTWTGLTGSFGTSGNDVYNTPGSYTWVASQATTTVTCLGPGGGSGNGAGDGGGGGGYAQLVLATTIGKAYNFTVPAGGQGGQGSPNQSNNGQNGSGPMTFTGDNGTVTANPGHGGSSYPNTHDGVGGTATTTGGTSPVTHTGGAGGQFIPTLPFSGSQAGAGGGSSAGSAANGNAGGGSTGNSPGNGGAAPTGGFKGSAGAAGPSGNPNSPGIAAGAGGGCINGGTGYQRAGVAGGSAQIQFVYTPSSSASTNVFRFVLFVPKHGGNNNAVLTRWLTGSANFARIDVQYGSGGNVFIKVYNSSSVLQFTSANLNVGDNTTVMVSVELQNSGTSVNWALTAIKPGIGQSKIGIVSGTQASSAVGNVTELIVAPNGDVTKTAMGHFSVQYALIDLTHVSAALDGHTSEHTVDRFIRLITEESYNAETGLYNEGADHWGFEGGVQSWAGTNCALTSDSTSINPGFIIGNTGDLGSGQVNWWNWPADGIKSLKIVANGVGAIKATSPTGTSGQPVQPGDIVSVACDFYTPSAVSGLQLSVNFFNGAGTSVGLNTSNLDSPTSAGEIQTVKVTTGSAGAPSGAATFAVSVTSTGTLTNGTVLFIDNVRVGPRLSYQTRKKLDDFIKELREAEQGMIKESKKLFGLGFRTRISMINQTPAVTLDYSLGQLADVPQPVFDQLLIKNDVTVRRHKGSKIRIVQPGGPMSVNPPPNGVGRFRKIIKAVTEIDSQLAAMAAHILQIGTGADERYPTVTVDMTRPEVASLFNSVPSAGPGDYVKMINLPGWYPSATAKQLILGYTETINAYKWTIQWNCAPEAPFEISSTAIRRW